MATAIAIATAIRKTNSINRQLVQTGNNLQTLEDQFKENSTHD